MKRFIFFVFMVCISSKVCISQSAPNLANASVLSSTAEKASQLSTVPVNIFTGVPQIGVPIYSYSNPNNGLSFNMSLNYFAGGTKVAEEPATAGLGWYLSTGGTITRTVRGAPDDQPATGFMYAAAIPADYRSNGDKYYFDSLDAQQDIFQFSFNGYSGKFFMGKNGQIAVLPASKIKIIPIIGTGSFAQKIIAFRIVTESGVKYDFNNAELTTITTKGSDSSLFRSAYSGQPYYSAWYLTQVIAAFNTDTIKINYTQTAYTSDFRYPQVVFVRNSDTARTKTLKPTGTNSSTLMQVSSVVFPEKTTVALYYNNYGITKIKIKDSVFRYGYALDYITNYKDIDPPVTVYIRPMLQSITPYTAKERQNGYFFTYNTLTNPYFPLNRIDSIAENSCDHWGYYNGAPNGANAVPQINGYTWGANRSPNSLPAMRSTLMSYTVPNGGTINYDYELNDHLPYTKAANKITVSPTIATSNIITLSQVFNTKHQLIFMLDSTVLRTGTVPITGTGIVTINIKNTAGTITYSTLTLSLYDLFYQGMKSFTVNVPNGNYLLDKPAVTGTTITGAFPINISWENRLADTTHTAIQAGGLRVKRVTRTNSVNDPAATVQEYKYINTDGTSSGFLGDIPKYDYPYQETVSFGGVTTTSYTVVSSAPVNTMDYAQGSPVGYSRVEIINGTATHNIGKAVYEFTSLQEVNAGTFTPAFPYAPQELRDWGIGLPKKISVYDSTGRLLKKTTNNYGFDSSFFTNSNFKSIKLGNSFTYYNGDPTNTATPKTRTYLAQEYYPVSGRAYVISSLDTAFQVNGSVNSSYANFTYDTNYNAVKVVASYDRNRGLQIEKRFYYPYNYTIGGSIGKLRDSGIITATIATESWITGDANPRIISGTITDYQQAGLYIKPLTVYALQANAPVPLTTIGAFNPALLNRSSTLFVPQVSFSIYNSRGTLLQSQAAQSGINNSVIMDYNQQYTIAKVGNAAVADIAYSSFEADGSGNWTIASLLRDSLNAITGKKSYNLGNGNITKSSLTSSTAYLVSVWAKTGAAVSVNGSLLSTILATQNNWNLYSVTLTGITSITVSGTGLIDELRLHPKDANMVTSTYEPIIGVTSMADANNTIMYNEYDNSNRLKLIRDKDKNIIKRYDYTDTTMFINIAPKWDTTMGCVRDNIGNYNTGYRDSTITDSNPYSDTYAVTIKAGYYNYCFCPPPTPPLDYKIVNGLCQQASRCNTSSLYVKIINPDNTFYWTWRCIYHYQWTDGSVSGNYTEYNATTACTLGCVNPNN